MATIICVFFLSSSFLFLLQLLCFSQKWLFNGSEIMHAASFHNISRFHTHTQKLRSNQVHMRVLMGRKDPIIKSRKVILRFFYFFYIRAQTFSYCLIYIVMFIATRYPINCCCPLTLSLIGPHPCPALLSLVEICPCPPFPCN